MFSRQIYRKLLILISLVLAGSLGFCVIEGWNWFDALYMTVITLSTIGYGETFPLSPAGRSFNILLILGGGGAFVYFLTDIIRLVVSGEVRQTMEKRKMRQMLRDVHDHVIVCGYGRMGKLVCKDFQREKVPFVIVDKQADLIADLEADVGIPLTGDATSDETLRKAGIDRARALVTVMASDADNLFTTMSARLLNPHLFIVARIEEMHAEQKFVRAGANRVVSPYNIGGTRVAQAVLRPTVVDFIELATRIEHIELQMEESRISVKSQLQGKSLRESNVAAELKIILIAVKKSSGHMLFNPPPETILEVHDILIAIGHRDQLQILDRLAHG